MSIGEKHSGEVRSARQPSPIVRSYSVRSGAKILVFGFAFVILLGAILLKLPIASAAEPLTWLEAFFTSTSATTVTGLILFNTQNTFSLFGELTILGLIQVGGIGFVTLSVFLLRLIGRNVSLGERRLLRSVLGVRKIGNTVTRLTIAVVGVVVSLEIAGAVLLYFGWREVLSSGEAMYFAIFHSVSSFSNAGFDLFTGFADPALIAVRDGVGSLLVMAALITVGTMGIAALFDVLNYHSRKRLSLHTRLILPLMVGITILGTGVFWIEHLVGGGTLGLQEALTSFFTVISSRTAGVSLVDVGTYGPASQLAILVMMFIGGAPASMGGGVGLTTIAVMLVAFWNTAKGNSDIRAFGRTIPTETIYKALAILGVSSMLVVGMTLSVLISEGGDTFPLLFEVMSAFSNTGYSLGVTAQLSPISQLFLMFTMFWGRLGPLTLVVALAGRSRRTQLKFPEERIIIG